MTRRLAGVLLVVVAFASRAVAAASADSSELLLPQWAYFQEVPLPADAKGEQAASKWCDFILTPSVFDQAREDLGDLRLYDASGVEIPYALRIRRPVDVLADITVREFNRAVGPEQSSELTLDLGADPPEHNQVEINTPGINYRRAVHLEGSADGQSWSKLFDQNLIDFKADGKELKDRRLDYPPSRFRYLRVRVFRDPAVDEKPVDIGDVTVRHMLDVPGEFVRLPADLGPREAVRVFSNPGSAWILYLSAAHQPCEKLLVEIGDDEFARDYRIEAGGVAGCDEPFRYAAAGSWSRHAGDPRKPLEANFSETTAGRLKLIVTDYRNPPLDIRGAQVVAPARQIVFQRIASLAGPLRLYYGNAKAEPPHYDLERNLPAQLLPLPVRLTLDDRQANPVYVPEPKPLSERWPWAIYVVLGAASASLAYILVNLGQTAVALHAAGDLGKERLPSINIISQRVEHV